jgi:threonine 3-dehydrogenase
MITSAIPETMSVPHFVGQRRIGITQKPVGEPGPGELLLQIRANALCGSERGQFANGSAVTPGHEAAGIVVAAGPGTHTPLGTPGVVFLMDFCGACRSCRLGFTNQCLHKRGDMGFNKDGGYGAFELVSEQIFFAVDADIPLTDATMLLDVMGTSAHAIKRGLQLRADVESVLITGSGPVGLGMLAIAKLLLGQATPVLITDIVPYRLALAERLGGVPIDLRSQSLEAGAKAAGFETVDLAIDTSGKTTARQAALDQLGKRSVLVCVGHGEELHLTVSSMLIAPERAVLGSEYFCFNELPASLELLRSHRAYLSQIITHRFAVGAIEQAFELFFAGSTGKVVIEQ